MYSNIIREAMNDVADLDESAKLLFTFKRTIHYGISDMIRLHERSKLMLYQLSTRSRLQCHALIRES